MLKEITEAIQEFNPGTAQLRVFGAIIAVISAGVFLWGGSIMFAGLAATVIAISVVWPKAYIPVAKILIAITYPIGWLLSRLLLLAFFFLIVTPVSVVRRAVAWATALSGEEPDTYWCSVEKNEHHDRMTL